MPGEFIIAGFTALAFLVAFVAWPMVTERYKAKTRRKRLYGKKKKRVL